MFAAAVALACLATAYALPQDGLNPGASTLSFSVTTATASPSAAATASIPSQIPLPPKQAWCPSDIFCAGDLLQTLNVASLYPDPKTIVDKPTGKSPSAVLFDFAAIPSPRTYGTLTNFVDTDFRGEGLELQALSLPSFSPNPPFLNKIQDGTVRAWSQTVHGYWTQLIRSTQQSVLCDGKTCESSLIPLNHTFVVPGGRFREQYYWDSYWIILGLIQSELFDVANQTLQNFMDEIEHIGFIPNGGRIYYLNRSQPPLFIHMLTEYVAATKDTGILNRALPLAERELKWWDDNRTVRITSPFTSNTHTVARYAVTNTAPRPESYIVDYMTATTSSLNESQRNALYGELASGAETGWDYTARWLSNPSVGLRSLNVKATIPICLNSILYRARLNLADLYDMTNGDPAVISNHRTVAGMLRKAILDLFWDKNKLAFYDFNLTSNARNNFFSAAAFYPLWNGIVPDEVLGGGPAQAFGMFASLHMIMRRYNGTFPSSFVDTSLQWDAPNAWPPHQYILLAALQALPSNLTSGPLPQPSRGQSAFSLIPPGQLGLLEEQLPGQPLRGSGRNASSKGTASDVNVSGSSVVNGGNSVPGEGWATALERQLANRYISSAFCSWYGTGGQIPGILPRLSDEELNVTKSINNTGNMFEKFSNLDVDSAGRGGEYTVQAGFGWTNGVVLWIASNYGNVLVRPSCPSLLDSQPSSNSASITAPPVSGIGILPVLLLLAF